MAVWARLCGGPRAGSPGLQQQPRAGSPGLQQQQPPCQSTAPSSCAPTCPGPAHPPPAHPPPATHHPPPTTPRPQDAPAANLPIELPAELATLMTALSEDAASFGWTKMPAVIVQGALPLDEQGLTNLEFVGLPLTPAASDKAPAEQLSELFKANAYPENKTYYL
jgi:hypothetical protein